MALTRIGNTSIRTDTSFVFTANTTHTGSSSFTGANTTFTANVNFTGANIHFANSAGVYTLPVIDFSSANVLGLSTGGGAQANAITVYTAAQRFDANNITNAGGDGYGGSTVTLNFANNNYFDIDLANNIVLANPTNISNTQGGSIFLTQDSTGNRTVTFGSYWRFPSGAAPSLSTAGNAQDRLDYVVKSSNTIHASVTLDLLGT
jgi:hypothetical protein